MNEKEIKRFIHAYNLLIEKLKMDDRRRHLLDPANSPKSKKIYHVLELKDFPDCLSDVEGFLEPLTWRLHGSNGTRAKNLHEKIKNGSLAYSPIKVTVKSYEIEQLARESDWGKILLTLVYSDGTNTIASVLYKHNRLALSKLKPRFDVKIKPELVAQLKKDVDARRLEMQKEFVKERFIMFAQEAFEHFDSTELKKIVDETLTQLVMES